MISREPWPILRMSSMGTFPIVNSNASPSWPCKTRSRSSFAFGTSPNGVPRNSQRGPPSYLMVHPTSCTKVPEYGFCRGGRNVACTSFRGIGATRPNEIGQRAANLLHIDDVSPVEIRRLRLELAFVKRNELQISSDRAGSQALNVEGLSIPPIREQHGPRDRRLDPFRFRGGAVFRRVRHLLFLVSTVFQIGNMTGHVRVHAVMRHPSDPASIGDDDCGICLMLDKDDNPREFDLNRDASHF